MMREKAHAKINLYLHITGRRHDGYHMLDSLAVFASSCDELTAIPASSNDAALREISLEINGPFSNALADCEDNLILKAARHIREFRSDHIGSKLCLTLTKNLPVASGIGGGSADAAAALRVLAAHWNIKPGDLPTIARALGADVPVCLAQRPALMRGVGECLTKAPQMPHFYLLLVNPGVAVSTPAIFEAWKARRGRFRRELDLPSAWPNLDAMIMFLRETTNDLEGPARSMHPVIDHVLTTIEAFPKCKLARMSGSGATCFGVFEAAAEAEQASKICHEKGWWAEAGPALASF